MDRASHVRERAIVNLPGQWKANNLDVDTYVQKLREKIPSNYKFVLKGIMCIEDAEYAVEHFKPDAIWVSNKQGMVQDTAPSSISVLKRIAEVAKGKTEILFEGGIRRGGDVVKAIACGADYVFVGQPAVWALHVGGLKGIDKMFSTFKREIDITLVLLDTLSLK